jgi:hypothetical protein
MNPSDSIASSRRNSRDIEDPWIAAKAFANSRKFFERFLIFPRITSEGWMSAMRILVRDRETKLFYAGDDKWKPEAEKAIPFPSSINAWKLVLKALSSRQLELVYFFDDRQETLSCPIEPPPQRAFR